MLKKIYLLSLLFCLGSFMLTAQLNTGDILFVGFRFDGVGAGDFGCGDGFAFTNLVDVPANTTIFFCEDEYNNGSFEGNEGDVSWTHTEVLPAGSVVEITTNNQGGCATISTNIGTAQFENFPGANSWSVAASQEELYAYLGSLRQPTTWLTGLFCNTANNNSPNNPPTELDGFTIDFTNTDIDADLGIYTGSCTLGVNCQASILDPANWTTEDGDGADCCDADGVDYPEDLPEGFNTPTKGTAYISNFDAGTVSVIDLETHALVTTIDVGGQPFGCAIKDDYTKVYISDFNGALHVIDAASNAIDTTIQLSNSGALGVAYNAPENSIVVTNSDNSIVYFVNATTYEVISVSNILGAYGVAVAANGNTTVVGDASIYTFTGTSLSETINQSGLKTGITFAPNGTLAYISLFNSDQVARFQSNPPQVTATIPVGSEPFGLVVNSSGDKLYVANDNSNTLSVISDPAGTPSLEATIPVGVGAFGIDLSPDGKQLYVSCRSANEVHVIDVATNTAIDTIPVGSTPFSFGEFISPYENDCVDADEDGICDCVEVDINFTADQIITYNPDAVPTGLGMVSPAGGVFSGEGIVDDGNGMTFSFDAATYAPGSYTVTYTITGFNDCTSTEEWTIEVSQPLALALSLDTICVNNGVRTGLGGGTPVGGVYSGTGVTDDGNGMTFTLDPAAAGLVTSIEITYTLNNESVTDEIVVVERFLSFEYAINGNMVFGQSASASIFSDVTIDFGDGTIVVTSPIGFPSHTYEQVGTYAICATQLLPDNCDTTICQTVIIEPFLPGETCGDAESIDSLFHRPQNVSYTSSLFTNVNYTTDESDPTFGWECFGEPNGNGASPSLERTRWFSFIGDGNMYYITTVECNSTDYIDSGDTQMAIYSGVCDTLMAEACNEDGPDAQPGGPFPAGLEFQTQEGVEYLIMIDGFGPNFDSDGEFCIQVTNLSITNTQNILTAPFEVFPNPSTGHLTIQGILPDAIRIQDSFGRLLLEATENTNQLDLSDLPNGVYFIQVGLDGAWASRRIVKQ